MPWNLVPSEERITITCPCGEVVYITISPIPVKVAKHFEETCECGRVFAADIYVKSDAEAYRRQQTK